MHVGCERVLVLGAYHSEREFKNVSKWITELLTPSLRPKLPNSVRLCSLLLCLKLLDLQLQHQEDETFINGLR